jgi:hypothetical protein
MLVEFMLFLKGVEIPRMTEETRKKSYITLIFWQKGSRKYALLIGDFASVDNKYIN